MSGIGEALRKRHESRARKEMRKWVSASWHPRAGYWLSQAPEVEHGTWNGYNNWYCRCPACAEANRAKVERYTKRRKA